MAENPPKQNMVSFPQAVDDLLKNIQMGDNSAIKGSIDPATGRMIITYAFNSSQQPEKLSYREANQQEKEQAEKNRDKLPDGVILQPLTPIEDHHEVTAAIRAAMDDIESVCNVKFVPVYHVDKRESANLCFFDGDITGQGGHAKQNTNPFGRRDIFINTHLINSTDTAKRGTFGYKAILHEIMHGMGVSHPGSDGKAGTSGGSNLLYSEKGTLMSYNSEYNRGMGPFDLAVLQYLYNEPQLKNGAKPKTTFTAEDLINAGTLYSQSKEVDIDVSQTNKKGSITADLSAKLPGEGGIAGNFGDSYIALSYAEGVRVRNINATGSNVSLQVTGNELPNRIIGGNNEDEITFHGGKDTAAGGLGYDKFFFNEHSGKGNVITDFSFMDSIYIDDKIQKVAVITDPKTNNNKLLFADKNGKIVADVVLQGLDEKHQAALHQAALLNKKSDNIFQHNAAKNSTVAVQMVDPMEIAEYAQGVKAAEKKLEEVKKAAAQKLAEMAEAAKQLAEVAAAKKLAAAKKAAEEAAAKKLAEEAEAKRLAAAKKAAEEAAANKLEEEKKAAAAAKKIEDEAAAKKLAEQTAAKKLAEEKKAAEQAAAKKLADEKKAAATAAKKLADEKKAAATETSAGASVEPKPTPTPHKPAPATGWNHWMEENAQWAMPLMTALPVLAAALSGGGGILLALLAAGIAALVGVGLARQYQDTPESTSVVAQNVANGGVDTRQASNTDGLMKAKALFDQGYRSSDMQDNGHGLSNVALVRSGSVGQGVV